ncbi:hypothetical protein ABHN11_05310 [Brevibacillus centrosporus]|uniref:hypothetical protein n=1 Tax=Brevibacillus centrosporus TaxID=54910 RepID=UPI003D242F63
MFRKVDEELSFFSNRGYSVIRDNTHTNVRSGLMHNEKTGFVSIIQATIVNEDEQLNSVILNSVELGFLKELP